MNTIRGDGYLLFGRRIFLLPLQFLRLEDLLQQSLSNFVPEESEWKIGIQMNLIRGVSTKEKAIRCVIFVAED